MQPNLSTSQVQSTYSTSQPTTPGIGAYQTTYTPASVDYRVSSTYTTGPNLQGYTSGTYGLSQSAQPNDSALELLRITNETLKRSAGPGSFTAGGANTYTSSNYGQSGSTINVGGYAATPTGGASSYYSNSSTPQINFLGNLRQSAFIEAKSNIDRRGPQFANELQSQYNTNAGIYGHQTRTTYDILKQYGLLSSQRLEDPSRIWQSSQNTSNYAFNVQPVGYQSPNRQGEVEKRAVQSVPTRTTGQESRQSVLSPYRNSMYPEFEIVEDLPDRRNLIDSINSFLQKSPARETLLVSPARVSISRKSLLSPADIEVQSLLKEKLEDGSIYEGEGRNGVRHGKGRIIYKDGSTFEGEFVDGKPQGTGIHRYRNGKVRYQGGVSGGAFHGQGVLQNETPVPLGQGYDHRNFANIGDYWTKYEGEFLNGKRHGTGTLYFSNGERFSGQFVEDRIEGAGNFFSRDGGNVQGTWENNAWRQ